MSGGDVLIHIEGAVGQITLNRQAALNALTLGMIETIDAALRDWQHAPDIHLILIRAVPGRAFCAGGDIAALYAKGLANDLKFGRRFWQREYRLNALIATYGKPIVAVMDGIVMGGGAGISLHCSHRIVTERCLFAMPECSIGLIPDVGTSLLLAHAPGRIGEYLALTGHRIDAADLIAVGLADHFVPCNTIESLAAMLCATADPLVISSFVKPVASSALLANQAAIDRVFASADVTAIFAALVGEGDDWAAVTHAELGRGAPLSLHFSLQTLRAARGHGQLALALRDEYRFVSRSTGEGELLEGIRAAVIDKDRSPVWRHPDHDDLPPALLSKMAGPASDGDLILQGDMT